VSYLEGISNYLGSDARVLYVTEDAPLDAIVDTTEFSTSPGGSRGLKGEYFNNDSLQGDPALVRTDEKIGFRWGEGSYINNGPVDHFSVRWTGYFVPRADDDYKFYVSADDGVRLYVNDQRVIDDWQRHGETLDTYAAHLDAGKPYKIRLEYFEAVGTATARFGIAAATKGLGEGTRALAAKADAVILCMGFDPSSESEGGDRTFRLPAGQDTFIQQIASVNKNVIVVLTAGGNVDMTKWIDNVSGLIHAWYPGQEGGTALAQILFGDFSPSGKLPASFERRWEDNAAYDSYYPKNGDKHIDYKEGVFVGYRHFDRSTTKPLFPFGYGLSYTKFEYGGLMVSPAPSDLGAAVSVFFDVKNTGSRAGAEVAEVYVGDLHASVPRPVKELKAFAKIDLQPGETKRILVRLDRRAFSFFDVKKEQWSAEPGEFAILVGSSSNRIELQGKFVLAPVVQEKR
jgi:beta-glucosidase